MSFRMEQGGVPEAAEEITVSINGAHADDGAFAPDAQQKGEMPEWVVEINKRLDERFADATEQLRAPTRNNESKPSIFLTGRPPKKFYIGYLLRHDWADRDSDQSEMWEYAAFMTKKLGLDVNGCLEFMKENEKLVHDYYDDEYKAVLIKESPRFLESLLAASCFLCFALLDLVNELIIPENLRWIFHDRLYKRLSNKIWNEATRTQLDMLNPENQIPWIIVKYVYAHSILSNANFERLGRHGTLNIIESLAIAAFDNLYPRENKSKVTNPTFPQQGFGHLLDLFHWIRSPSELKFMCEISLNGPKHFGEFFIPNATELLGSATVFKKLDGTSGCDVKFSEKTIRAVMQLGPLHLFPYSHELYSHLIIFEQKTWWQDGSGFAVTAHFACMKSLLQTKEDVKLLQKNGIVQNILQGEKDVLNFVHDMGKLLVEETNSVIPDELDELSKKVIEHHERRASRAYTEIKNQFCPSKWVIISIIAAFVLFGLTIIQTIYIGLGYYKT